MDIEQLKLVLEMVGTATEGATWFAFAWLAKGFVSKLVGCCVVVYAIHRIASLISSGIKTMDTLRDMRGVNPKLRDYEKSGELTASHLSAIKDVYLTGCAAIKAERNGV